jgi:hypothetical protein
MTGQPVFPPLAALEIRQAICHYPRSNLFHARLLEEVQGVGPGCLLHERHLMI